MNAPMLKSKPPVAPDATGLVPLPDNAGPHEVLVVEDSLVEQHRMQAMLRRLGYEVTTANDGRQALEILGSRPIPLVLSDWRMPQMSGIELCRAVRDDPTLGQPYLILVTGRNTAVDLVAGMDAGADDYIGKPFNVEELRVRLQAGVRLLDLRNEAERRNVALAQALEREAEATQSIRRDLAAAASLQRESLPRGPSPFPELRIAALFRAAAHVAGDGYGYFPLDDRHLAFFQIDVTGHGVASAMLSFTVSRLLLPGTGAIALTKADAGAVRDSTRALPDHIVAPHRVVHALNRRFADSDDCKYYFTMVYGVLDVTSGRGELCQAGHPYPLIAARGGPLHRLGRGGFPVGMLAQAAYESVAFHLDSGGRLYLYSDGITDCASTSGHLFGERRLTKALGQSQDDSLGKGVRQLERVLMRWQGDAGDQDDMSLLAIERAPIR